MSSDIEIITYGGGDLLRGVFNAISMLFYGRSEHANIVQPLCTISAMIGGAWGISKCFFQSYTDAFFTKYFLPLLAVPTLLIVPKADVHIIDRLNDQPIKVNNIPFLFAKIAGLSSDWGYKITNAIELVMHTPNDVMYSKTGMLFAAESSLDFSRLMINNGTLAQNLHQFTQQCIIYDIALGRYSIDDLRKTSDLLGFFKENTSKVRMIPYTNPSTKQTDLLSCQESVDLMSPLFDEEATYYTRHEIFKKMPIAYQALVNFKDSSENRLSGQMAEAVLSEEGSIAKDILVVNAFNDAQARFAVERARDNQRSTYQTAGALAGTTLVTMRIVFEALIYASFALIVPLSLLPGGIRFIGSWIFLNVWIQLWPPLYGIINYITMICAKRYASSIMGGVSDGFSLFTSAGFQDLALDTAALGGFLSLSVPLLSFYLLQNLQSIVHLSGSLLTPAHSSAISAGSELSSGNYSYANANMGQLSYDNQTAFQHNSAPSLSSGFFTDNYGTHQIKYGQEILTVNQDPSHLNTSISTADAYATSLQHAKQHAESRVNTMQESYTKTQAVAERSTADLIQHIASGDSYSDSVSTSDVNSIQESANFIMNTAQSFSQQHGVSVREGLEYSVGICVANGSCSSGSDEVRTAALNTFGSEDFQKHYQNVFSTIKGESANFMTDEGKRYAESCSSALENLKSSQQQLSDAHSELNQISENLSYVQSHTSSVNTNLNTEFSNWLNEQGALGAIFDRSREQELNSLRDTFIGEKCQSQIPGLTRYQDPSLKISTIPLVDLESNTKESIQEMASSAGLHFGQASDSRESVSVQVEGHSAKVSHRLSMQNQKVSGLQQNVKKDYVEESQKSGFRRLNDRTAENIHKACDDAHRVFDIYANPS